MSPTSASTTIHFECVVSSTSNLRTFGSAFQALAKHGKDVMVEATPTSLNLRAINDSKTAFVSYLFCQEFFEVLNFSSALQSQEVVAAKIGLKMLLTVFRTLRSIERLVISLVTIGAEHLAVFSAHCKHGIVKTHRFHYEEVPVVCS